MTLYYLKKDCDVEFVDTEEGFTTHCVEGNLYEEGYNLHKKCGGCQGKGWIRGADVTDRVEMIIQKYKFVISPDIFESFGVEVVE